MTFLKFLVSGCIIFLSLQTINIVYAQTESIIYTNKVSRNANIHMINMDGTSKRKITNASSSDSAPSYSPDGDFIIFNSERNGWWKIWKMSPDGSNITQVSFPKTGADYDPTVSPNGQYFAYTSSQDNQEEIYLKKIGSEVPPLNLTNLSGDQRYPRWISNNEIIYYDTSGEYHKILTVNLKGELVGSFDLGKGNNYMGDFSKDGNLVFTSDRDGTNDLYILFSDSTFPIKITESNDLIDYRAKWSTDGTKIVFERSHRKNISQIWVYDLKTETTIKVTHSGYNYYPSWIIN